MNLRRTTLFAVVALGTLSVAGALAVAADIPFAHNAAGSNARFVWSGGANSILATSNGSHGSPDVSVDGFQFQNSFLDDPLDVAVSNATHTTVDAHLEVILDATGPAIDTIIIRESGSFYFGGANPADVGLDFAGTAGTIAIVSLVPDLVFVTPVTFDPITYSFNPGSSTDGTWSMEIELAYNDPRISYFHFPWMPPPTPAPWDFFTLKVDNHMKLTAAGAANNSSMMKDRMDIFVPEPGSLVLLGCLGPVLLWRRNRRSA